jgi:4-amino-4-deoxy-L-arabinose transferase-like glycosyltransferase
MPTTPWVRPHPVRASTAVPFGPVHNLMLVAIAVLLGGAAMIMIDERRAALLRSPAFVIAIAALVGLIASLLVVQRFEDLIPDSAEDVLSPAVAIGITAVLAFIGWRRHASRL